MMQNSPSGTSSPPPLVDMSEIPTVEPMDTQIGNPSLNSQSFDDHRSVNVDQRSIHLEQHVHNPDPAVVGQMAAAVASSELRVEATQAVAQAREAAMQAATDVRVEAAQAVASARIETTTAQASAEATRVSALAEIQHLRNQLEAS